jgi:signal transduction histidine kinase
MKPAPVISLPTYDVELSANQRHALRMSCLLGAPMLVAFALLDLQYAPALFWPLLAARLLGAAGLLAVAHAAPRGRTSGFALSAVAVAILMATIELAVLATGGAHSPYATSVILVLAGIGILMPLSPRQSAVLQALTLGISVLPMLPLLRQGEARTFATNVSYLLCVSIVAVAGAQVHDRLRRREHRARLDAARQAGLVNLGTLAGGLAHDLASPLTYVGLELELLEQLVYDPEVLQRVRAAQLGTTRMRQILEAMRQGARLSSGELRDVKLVQELELALTLLGQRLKQGVTVAREYDADVPLVACQPTLLGQVLVNLLVNALDATSGVSGPTIVVRVRSYGGQVVVEVEDNGPGVPQELRGRIFDPFFSTKGEKGNGLGLWISAEIARVHGGELSVHRGALGGALFRLALRTEPARAATG